MTRDNNTIAVNKEAPLNDKQKPLHILLLRNHDLNSCAAQNYKYVLGLLSVHCPVSKTSY